MNRGLYDLVIRQLDADANLDSKVARLIRAACSDDAALGRALQEPAWEVQPPVAEVGPSGAGSLLLRRLTVAGFRGIGDSTSLELEPGPGLTLVAGRNGSGKSSLAEGLEVLLYGDLSRWDEKSTDWKKEWTNIHTDGPVFVEVQLDVEGSSEPLTVRREWPSRSTRLDKGEVGVSRGDTEVDWEEFAFEKELALYRRILSYGDLGRRLERKPSQLYDDVAGMLGLEELTSARSRLQFARSERKKRREEIVDEAERLRKQLQTVDDARALESVQALAQDPWDLDAIRELLHGRGQSAEQLARLRNLAGLESRRRRSSTSAAPSWRRPSRPGRRSPKPPRVRAWSCPAC